jgi:hypothetical protein
VAIFGHSNEPSDSTKRAEILARYEIIKYQKNDFALRG